MEKLFNFILLQKDKANHALYGLVIYNLLSIGITPIWSFVVVLIIAVGKEVYDYRNKDNHTADIYDAIYTFIAPLVFMILYYTL